MKRGKAAEGRTHSKTLRARGAGIIRASVLECASPLALWNGGADFGSTRRMEGNTVNIVHPEDVKRLYGPEYPVAMVIDGIRIPLTCEKRFSRCYHSDEANTSHGISRFMDGSASITASELKREWPDWAEEMQVDFCQNCAWLKGQSDFPEMLRFVMRQGNTYHWSGIALEVAYHLPQEEAFNTLVDVLHKMNPGETSNISQGIAHTKHPDAGATLRKHLTGLWKHPELWNNDEFVNWIGFDATTCVAHLIELGASPDDFENQVRQLSQHVCTHNRESCRNFLSKHYAWLK